MSKALPQRNSAREQSRPLSARFSFARASAASDWSIAGRARFQRVRREMPLIAEAVEHLRVFIERIRERGDVPHVEVRAGLLPARHVYELERAAYAHTQRLLRHLAEQRLHLARYALLVEVLRVVAQYDGR